MAVCVAKLARLLVHVNFVLWMRRHLMELVCVNTLQAVVGLGASLSVNKGRSRGVEICVCVCVCVK